MRNALAGSVALVLTACSAAVADRGQAVPEANAVPAIACDAGRAEAFIGRPADAVAEGARRAAGAKAVRVIGPDQTVTMDFRPDRLNVETDKAGAVVKVRCG